MSYLVHLHPGGPQPAQPLGSPYGNFVKGRLQGRWPDEIKRTTQLHRHIDVLTDSHPLVHMAKRRLPSEYWCFTGILLDASFDRYPTHGRNDYADGPLPQLIEQVYGTLCTVPPLPERLVRIVPWMAAQDWLSNYRELVALREVLGGTSWRLSRPHLLDDPWEELAQHCDDPNADFRAFHPQLQAFALDQR